MSHPCAETKLHVEALEGTCNANASKALANLGDAPFAIARGGRIAQLVRASILRAALDQTMRGAGGFGSTGM